MKSEQILGKFRPQTLDKNAKTVDVCFATTAPVKRFGGQGEFYEILKISEEAINFERLASGAPVLRDHDASLENQVGVVEKAWISGAEAYAKIRLSSRAEEVLTGIEEGILQNVSVGYRVLETTPLPPSECGTPRLEVSKWEPLEVSLVAVGADPKAKIRSLESPPSPAPEQASEPRDRVAIERQRAQDILNLCTRHGLEALAPQLISEGKTMEHARQRVLDALASEQPKHNFIAGESEGEKRRKGLIQGLSWTYGIRKDATPNEFSNRKFIDLAREEVTRSSGNRALSDWDVANRAFHSTSDFPLILSDLANVKVQDSFKNIAEKSTYEPLVTYEVAHNFKPIRVLEVDRLTGLEHVPEGATIEYGTFGESMNTYKISSYAKGFTVTREAIVNDDLGLILSALEGYGAQAARLESDLVYGLFNSNAQDSNHEHWFTDRNTLAGDLTLETLEEAEFRISELRGKQGEYLSLKADILLLPTRLAARAQRLLYGNYLPNMAEQAKVQSSLKIISEPRLNVSPSFYLCSTQLPIVRIAHLDGNRTPTLSSEVVFDPRGGMRIRLDFDVGVTRGHAYSAFKLTGTQANKGKK